MNQPGASPKSRDSSNEGRARLHDPTHPIQLPAPHSRVGNALGWLKELFLLASLAAVCSSTFDIANGRASHQLDDVVHTLHVSAVAICAAIVLGLYLSIFRPSLCSSGRPSQPSPSLASSSAQPSPDSSPLDTRATSDALAQRLDRRAAAAETAGLSPMALSEPAPELPSPRDAPSSYSPAFVSQLRAQLVHSQHQLCAARQQPHGIFRASCSFCMSLEKTAHVDNVSILREQLQSLQTRLSTLQGWRMKELTDEQVEAVSEEVRDAMREFACARRIVPHPALTSPRCRLLSRRITSEKIRGCLAGRWPVPLRRVHWHVDASLSGARCFAAPTSFQLRSHHEPFNISRHPDLPVLTPSRSQIPCGHAQFCVKCCAQLQRCPLCRVPGTRARKLTLLEIHSPALVSLFCFTRTFQFKCISKYTAPVLPRPLTPRCPSAPTTC